jgi:hypothetical protein
MQILISPRWFTRSSAEPAKVEANIYTAKYWQHPYVSLNISQPRTGKHVEQLKLRLDISSVDARKLAEQLLRHAETIETEATGAEVNIPGAGN